MYGAQLGHPGGGGPTPQRVHGAQFGNVGGADLGPTPLGSHGAQFGQPGGQMQQGTHHTGDADFTLPAYTFPSPPFASPKDNYRGYCVSNSRAPLKKRY